MIQDTPIIRKTLRENHMKRVAVLSVVFLLALGGAGLQPILDARQVQPSAVSDLGISPPALELLNRLALENQTAFFIYRDSDSGFNKGFASGFFGEPASALAKIDVNTACVFDELSSTGCSDDVTRIDRERGTVMAITFDELVAPEFAGINVEEPENHGVLMLRPGYDAVGYDLRGASRVCFDVRTPSAGLGARFEVARRSTPWIVISNSWTSMCFDFNELAGTEPDLTSVHFLFSVVTDFAHAPTGGTILLDNIRFEPVPIAQSAVPSFPLANQTVGVVPAPNAFPGRVSIPPDQVLANLTTTYESALTIVALLRSGDPSDLEAAVAVADALVYAMNNDNQGIPIPPAPDGSRGIHSAMSSGDLPLLNNQGHGRGAQGQIRLAGFTVSSDLCGETRFCLVLDGATGGNVAFAIFALTELFQRTSERTYLNAAKEFGEWIHGNLLDTTGTGFGGYYLGYPDEGKRKELLTGKSIENNADIFRAFTTLAEICMRDGLAIEAAEWHARAKIAGDFVMELFDPSDGRFYAGTVPVGLAPSPGIQPDGEIRGGDVINTFDFLDAETFVPLAMAASPLYRDAIDWRRPVLWMLGQFERTVFADGRQFHGFNLVASELEGPTGIAWEFTGQAIVTMRFVDRLYGESRFASDAQFYLEQIRSAQQFSPFADGKGLVAATIDGGDSLPPHEHCVTTPFQCIASRVGLAATTWAILAELDENPFYWEMAVCPDLDLESLTINTVEAYETCGILTAGPDVAVIDPGDVTFRAGEMVRLRNGFNVAGGAKFRIEIGPSPAQAGVVTASGRTSIP